MLCLCHALQKGEGWQDKQMPDASWAQHPCSAQGLLTRLEMTLCTPEQYGFAFLTWHLIVPEFWLQIKCRLKPSRRAGQRGSGLWLTAVNVFFSRCLSGYDKELQLSLLLLCCWHGPGGPVSGPGETMQDWAVPPPAAAAGGGEHGRATTRTPRGLYRHGYWKSRKFRKRL